MTAPHPAWQAVHPSWLPVIGQLRAQFDAVLAHTTASDTLPPGPQVLAALSLPVPAVKCVLLGQDPYPTPGHAMGLSFSAAPTVTPLPRSLRNIFLELDSDLPPAPGQPAAINATADLSGWVRQGVLLLNRSLTVTAGTAGSHARHGWQELTGQLLTRLDAHHHAAGLPLVALLWGKPAAAVAPQLVHTQCLISAHPSPLAARRGFFGSRPFSRCNSYLAAHGAVPIDWHAGLNFGADQLSLELG